MTSVQEASPPSVEEMRTLFFPEWAAEESKEKSALPRQMFVVQPFGMFPSTSSKEELTTADWLWEKSAASVEAASGDPGRQLIRIKAEKTHADFNFTYRISPPIPISKSIIKFGRNVLASATTANIT